MVLKSPPTDPLNLYVLTRNPHSNPGPVLPKTVVEDLPESPILTVPTSHLPIRLWVGTELGQGQGTTTLRL